MVRKQNLGGSDCRPRWIGFAFARTEAASDQSPGGASLARYQTAATALDALPAPASRAAAASRHRLSPLRPMPSANWDALVRLDARDCVSAGQPDYPAAARPIDDARGRLAVPETQRSWRTPCGGNGRWSQCPGQRPARGGELAADWRTRWWWCPGLPAASTRSAQRALRTGHTIAAVAGGSTCLPSEHARCSGNSERAVVAEAPIGTAPNRDTSRRNRIIAGLSLGVVVVEAGGPAA